MIQPAVGFSIAEETDCMRHRGVLRRSITLCADRCVWQIYFVGEPTACCDLCFNVIQKSST